MRTIATEETVVERRDAAVEWTERDEILASLPSRQVPMLRRPDAGNPFRSAAGLFADDPEWEEFVRLVQQERTRRQEEG